MAPILDSLSCMPPQGEFGLIIRHAHRLSITDWNRAFEVLITEQGRAEARQLGERLAQYGPIRLYHSPVERCAQTAQAIAEGVQQAGGSSDVKGSIDDIGGPYIRDMSEAMNHAKTLGHGFLRAWFDGQISEQFLLPRKLTAQLQLQALLQQMQQSQEVIPILVSHDWNLLALREEFLGLRHEDIGWLKYLDGLVCHLHDGQHILQYREHHKKVTVVTNGIERRI